MSCKERGQPRPIVSLSSDSRAPRLTARLRAGAALRRLHGSAPEVRAATRDRARGDPRRHAGRAHRAHGHRDRGRRHDAGQRVRRDHLESVEHRHGHPLPGRPARASAAPCSSSSTARRRAPSSPRREAALARSKSQFKRSHDLHRAKRCRVADLDQIEATLKTNEARVAAARARLDDTVIRAPFDGRTGFRHISVGSLVSPGTVITTLDDTSSSSSTSRCRRPTCSCCAAACRSRRAAAGLPDRTFTGIVTNWTRASIPSRARSSCAPSCRIADGVLRPACS